MKEDLSYALESPLQAPDVMQTFRKYKVCAQFEPCCSLLETCSDHDGAQVTIAPSSLVRQGHKVRLEPFLPEQLISASREGRCPGS